MSDPFVHLRVASGYSLQYGASHPSALVRAAVDAEADTLALTDRDGLYGAIRFAKACAETGIAPVIGADLALRPAGIRGRPDAHAIVGTGPREASPMIGRLVTLASSRRGWASLCRLVSAAHADGERGSPRVTRELIGRHGDDLVVMLGPDSDLGRALDARSDDRAETLLREWLDVVPRDRLAIGVTNHRVAGHGQGSASLAGRMLAFADRHGITGVLTNAVRMASRSDAPAADVLDAARRLVPLDVRNVDRRNAEGYLKSGKEMIAVAEEVCALSGRRDATRLFGATRDLAIRCRLDPAADVGLGEIHLPEFEVLGAADGFTELRHRCEAGLNVRYGVPDDAALARLDVELEVIGKLGFASYFLTVARVVDDIKAKGIRVAARGSGAGSLVNYALGISGVDPIRYGLIMERFLSPLRRALPDIDIDVESARRTDIYDMIFDTFGTERVACVAMMDTYRVRHAIRDVGAAMSLPPGDIDAIAKSFPHIRARDARHALRDLPELRAANLNDKQLQVLFELVERLDGLPRHVALHPCGVLLSDASLLDRTPVERSFGDYPMSQFDKTDVEDIGLLKLDVLGIRMQSSMAHAVDEVERTTGERIDLDALAPFDDESVYEMIGRAETLGCFQIESPGQRELVGKFGPRDFTDIVIDISLFRPGPVKSEMVTPFLSARNGWDVPRYLHPDLIPALAETAGVVVFHEQVIKIVSIMTGCSYAYGDEARRALGSEAGQEDVRRWFVPTALGRGYDPQTVEVVWGVLKSFASFGFCKAHAAAFALPTYQSAWLKRHHPAAFLSGVLSHDPGMYPKRLILEEARRLGIPILPLDVNRSMPDYRIEPVTERATAPLEQRSASAWPEEKTESAGGAIDGYGIRLSLSDVRGITDAESERIVAGRPYLGLIDFWTRAAPASDLAERLVLAGAFDDLYGIGEARSIGRRGVVTRRDLLLCLADLVRASRVDARATGRARGLASAGAAGRQAVQLALELGPPPSDRQGGAPEAAFAAERGLDLHVDVSAGGLDEGRVDGHVRERPGDVVVTGLPEMTADERMAAELDIIGLDATRHVLSDHLPFLRSLGIAWSEGLLKRRSRSSMLVAGVKVATQTPPVRSGKRVIFLTLDDTTGPVDLTFFADAQGPYAATVFNSWLLVGRGELRRTGPRGVSLRATGAWELTHLESVWRRVLDETGDEAAAIAAVHEIIDAPVEMPEPVKRGDDWGSGPPADTGQHGPAGGMGQRRVFVHPSGFVQNPYTDIAPAGESPKTVPHRKLWHSSQGSSGW
ncbi:DNA polymerase III subunit alpha [Propioniciclava tarda]|uniref:DNA-directed DNA polymerase n=1 Tax=Propioniciclava tarda TaxID=433330 RepID=A0A4Q9KK85_PROTD|nr:DNA polymerase III subunit alpha [Propioniciclava tarda]TBT94744.1 DNA polymerase III subunit alpha [Propioniciclava tarda]SMO64626.1 DNA polymerase III, alpha subunit [Propioniciclava tarda]